MEDIIKGDNNLKEEVIDILMEAINNIFKEGATIIIEVDSIKEVVINNFQEEAIDNNLMEEAINNNLMEEAINSSQEEVTCIFRGQQRVHI